MEEICFEGIPDALLDVLSVAASNAGAARTTCADATDLAVVVLGPDVDEPISRAQALARSHDQPAFLFVCTPERLDAMRNAVLMAPYLGRDARCASIEDEHLHTLVGRTVERARRKRRNRAMVDFAQASLGEKPVRAQVGRMLDRLLEHAPMGVALLDPSGRVMAWNRAAARITGTREGDAIGAGLAHALRALDPDEVERVLREGLDKHSVAVGRQGKEHHVELTSTAITEGGEDSRLVVFQDVTSRVDAQVALRTAMAHLEERVQERTKELRDANEHLADEVHERRRMEQDLTAAQELAHVGSFSVAPDGSFEATRELLRIVGTDALDLDRLIGVVYPDDMQAVRDALAEAQKGKSIALDCRILRGGAVRYAHLRARGSDGSISATVADVTERKRFEEERIKAIERLKEIERLKREDSFKTGFINAAAHELFTPMTPIRMQLRLLARRAAELDEGGRRNLEVLERNFERLERLVRGVLDTVRLNEGHLELKLAENRLDTVCRDVVDTFRPMAEEKGIELRFTGEVCTATFDADRIQQVIANLVSNAIKFTDEGHVDVQVTAARRIVVTDTGRGMDMADAESIFEPFTRLTDDPALEGTGLGLHITRGIVTSHGGTLRVDSTPGKGTRFTVELPERPAQVAAPRAPRNERGSEGR